MIGKEIKKSLDLRGELNDSNMNLGDKSGSKRHTNYIF